MDENQALVRTSFFHNSKLQIGVSQANHRGALTAPFHFKWPGVKPMSIIIMMNDIMLRWVKNFQTRRLQATLFFQATLCCNTISNQTLSILV